MSSCPLCGTKPCANHEPKGDPNHQSPYGGFCDPTCRHQYPPEPSLVEQLAASLANWDKCFTDVFDESSNWPFKVTEERLKVAVRNEMRKRGYELPEVIRWKLRMAIGYRSEEE